MKYLLRRVLFAAVALIPPLAPAQLWTPPVDEKTKMQMRMPAWPRTVDEAADAVLAEMDEESKKIVRNTMKFDLIDFHHGFGTQIRNNLGLWAGNNALLDDCGTDHPDDCSSKIIEAIWHKLQADTAVTGPARKKLEAALDSIIIKPFDFENARMAEVIFHFIQEIIAAGHPHLSFKLAPGVGELTVSYAESAPTTLRKVVEGLADAADLSMYYHAPYVVFDRQE